ncbi:uncharacterized protein [Musca autumnalis]|uniref:uncharacterized protein n=1 Tax=Musca autumnalis TaxID=221902 RepID=UPI003CF8C62C
MGSICRTCAMEQRNGDTLKLFDRRHKKLLVQIQEVTGILLKNSGHGLPKLMCTTCHQSLQQAVKFRENVIKVQALLADRLKADKEDETNGTTEFFQVSVKEEEFSVKSETTDVVEEKEIHIEAQDRIAYKAEDDNCNSDQKDTLEIKSNEKETLEDTSLSVLNEIWSESEDTTDFTASNTQYEEEPHMLSDTLKLNGSDSEREEMPNISLPRERNIKSRKRIATVSAGKADRKSLKIRPKESKPRKREKTDSSNRFICDQCGNNFTCSHYFKLHLRRHAGDRQCACELCPDKFFTNSELRRHMRKHTGERPFACQFCDRKFTDYSTRIKHQRTHTNERPFTCSQCGKSFTSTYILKNHMLTHTGERHFRCEVCDKAFARRTHLMVHYRSIMHKQALEKLNIPKEKNQPDQLEVNVDFSSLLV